MFSEVTDSGISNDALSFDRVTHTVQGTVILSNHNS